MKNEVSYSFHLSSGEHCISGKNVLIKASKHNNRLFEDSKEYNKELNVRLIGSDNIFNDVKQLYDDTFGESVIKHDLKIRGNRDKIRDYFEKIAASTKTHLAEEIIIMIGDKEFWEDRDFLKHKDKITDIFKEQINRLQELSPNFKIANATIHYDETSPHVHIVGVPTKRTPNKNLEIRVSKENCFTKESLAMLQEKMRVGVAEQIKEIYQDKNICEQEKVAGRKVSFKVAEYKWVKANENILKNKYSEHFNVVENKLKEKNLKIDLIDDVYTIQEQKETENRKLIAIRKAIEEEEEKLEDTQRKTKQQQELNQQLEVQIQQKTKNLDYIKKQTKIEEKNLTELKYTKNDLTEEVENLRNEKTILVTVIPELEAKKNRIQNDVKTLNNKLEELNDPTYQNELMNKFKDKIEKEQEQFLNEKIDDLYEVNKTFERYEEYRDFELENINEAVYNGDVNYVNKSGFFEYIKRIDIETKFGLLLGILSMNIDNIKEKIKNKLNINRDF